MNNIEKSCSNCLMHCSRMLKTCTSGEFAMWRPSFTKEAEEAEEISETDAQKAEALALYIAEHPKTKKRLRDNAKERQRRATRRQEDPEYVEHIKAKARARYWKDPEKARQKRMDAYRRSAATEEGRAKTNARNRQYVRKMKEEDPERYESRLEKRREYNRKWYADRTEEKRQKHNQRSNRRYTIMVATETAEEKAERNARNYQKRQEKFNAMTPEEQQAWRDKKNARRRELRAQRREEKKRKAELIKKLKDADYDTGTAAGLAT